MKTLLKNFLLSVSAPEEPSLSEAECLIVEIEKARDKIQYAWNRFNYAAPEYVDLAMLELHLAEEHYSLLNKRYRIMFDLIESPVSLDGSLQNPPFSRISSAPSR